MSDPDELDVNPFFKALQSKFLSTYERVQEECYLICIPQSECLHGVLITEKFVDTHILKPSPFFKGQYTTLRSEKQLVAIADDGNYVSTVDGFPTRTKIEIVSEELGYNKEYKPYKILIIARPLDHNVLFQPMTLLAYILLHQSLLSKRHSATDTASGSGEFKLKFTGKDCREFLNLFPEFSKSLKGFDEQIQKFLKSYIILKDYLEEAALRLYDIATATSQRCLKSVKDRKLSAQKFQDNVTAAVETCLIGSVHQKVYPIISSKWAKDDTTMLYKCYNLQGLTPDHLAVPKHFCCPVTSAVVELAHLQTLVTPIEKLYCLKTTIDSITEDINRHVRGSQPLGVLDEDLPCLTSDELLPILVTVIVQAKCSHIHSDIYYIDNFYWAPAHKDKDTLSYCLVTFKAAVQYIMTTDFSDLDLKTNGTKHDISFEELVKDKTDTSNKTDESQFKSQSRDKNSKSYAPSRSRYDQQMDNITRMLEESTKDMKPAKSETVGQPVVASIFGGQAASASPLPDERTPADKQNKQEDMGDFLSSLQNDTFLAFGKQT